MGALAWGALASGALGRGALGRGAPNWFTRYSVPALQN